jgi:hypothetical protein
VFGLTVGFAEKFLLQRREVVGDDQADLLLAPVFVDGFLLFGNFPALSHHGEAAFPQDEVRLAGSLAATEFFRLQDPTQEVATGQPDDGFRGVAPVGVDQLVPGGSAEWMIDALSRSANAWTKCSFFRPRGIDCGMTAPSPIATRWATRGTVARRSDYSISRQISPAPVLPGRTSGITPEGAAR